MAFEAGIPPRNVTTPEKFALLREVHQGTNGRLILCIQDAHSNLSGQKNLAASLSQIMQERGVSLVLTEGSSKEATLDPIKRLAPSKEILHRTAKNMLEQGKIAGEEYLNLTSDLPMKLMGVEDRQLYLESIDAYAVLATHRKETLRYLNRIQIGVEKIKHKLYPKAVLDYERTADRDGFWLKQIVPDWEKQFPNGVSAEDMESIFERVREAERKMYEESLKDTDAQFIRAIDRYLALLVSAYNIRMSSEEFKLFVRNEPDFATPDYLAFINRKLEELGFKDKVAYEDWMENGREALVHFYDLVSARDLAFVQNADRIMKIERQNTAVLITGGYHTDHLTHLLREEGYSYAVLTPFVTSETDQREYERRLLDSIHSTESTYVKAPVVAMVPGNEDFGVARFAEAFGLSIGDAADAIEEFEKRPDNPSIHSSGGARLAQDSIARNQAVVLKVFGPKVERSKKILLMIDDPNERKKFETEFQSLEKSLNQSHLSLSEKEKLEKEISERAQMWNEVKELSESPELRAEFEKQLQERQDVIDSFGKNRLAMTAVVRLSQQLRGEIALHVGVDFWKNPQKMRAAVSESAYKQKENEWMIGTMYMLLIEAGSMLTASLSYDVYRDIILGRLAPGETYFYDLVSEHERHFFGGIKRAELKPEEIRAIERMSVNLFRKAQEIAGKSAHLSENSVTIRELIRFYVDFSSHYLKSVNSDGTHQLGNVVRQFILTADNIYSRVLDTKEARKEFAHAVYMALMRSKEGQKIIFKAEQLGEFYSEDGEQKILDIMAFDDYERSHKDGPGRSDFENSLDAVIERAYQVSRPLLLVTNTDEASIVERAFQKIDAGDGKTVRFSASNFVRRKDFFGMYMPKDHLTLEQMAAVFDASPEEQRIAALFDILDIPRDVKVGQKELKRLLEDETVRKSVGAYLIDPANWKNAMEWRDGFLAVISRKAKEDPDHRYTLIIDNVEALPGRVRVLLNPVLWEKKVNVPDRGYDVGISPNVQFIFTADRQSVITDDSFLNRTLIHFTDSMNLSKEGFIAGQTGVSLKTEKSLWTLLDKLRSATWHGSTDWSVADLIRIAQRIRGVRNENPRMSLKRAFFHEAESYLRLRLKDRRDWGVLRRIFRGKISGQEIAVLRDGNFSFDGVKIETSARVKKYLKDHPKASVEDVLRDLYGFALTTIEKMVFSQFARDWKYGGRVVRLEGPSGEGKTKISRVFADLIELKIAERTVNAETGLGEFRGRFLVEKNGIFKFEEAEYVVELERGGYGEIINEINTNPDNGMYDWMFSEITSAEYKYLPEFASGASNEIRRVRLSEENMHFITANSDGTSGRFPTPKRIAAITPQYYMSSDPEELPALVEKLFQANGAGKYVKYSAALADVHRAIWNAKNVLNQLESPQDISRRYILRVIRRMNAYMKNEKTRMKSEQAFASAVNDIYGLSWQSSDNIKKSLEIIDQELSKNRIQNHPLDRKRAIRMSFLEDAPTMIFSDSSTENATDLVKAVIRGVDPGMNMDENFIGVPLSFYHTKSSWVGSWTPRAPQGADETSFGRAVQRKFPSMYFALGILPRIISEAKFLEASTHHPGSRHLYAVWQHYTRLNEKIMPFLNEFLQDDRSDVLRASITQENADDLAKEIQNRMARREIDWDILSEGYDARADWKTLSRNPDARLRFAKWFYSTRPRNLKIIALGSSQEEVRIGGPELDRFELLNLSVEQNKEWVRQHVEQWFKGKGMRIGRTKANKIIAKATEALRAYAIQKREYEYEHVRMGVEDLDVYLSELLEYRKSQKKDLEAFSADVDKIAYYVLGIGLRPAFREKLSFYPKPMTHPEKHVKYRKDDHGSIWFEADGVDILTSLTDIPENRLASTETIVRHLAGLIIAWRHNRTSIIEGFPGGGKTSLIEELARRIGIQDVYQEVMYEGIGLSAFLGQLSIKDGMPILTTNPGSDGKFLLSFLKAYSEGGAFNLDEGAVGVSSQEIIAFLTHAASEEVFDPSFYQPGYKGEVLRRHKDFRLFITQNPAGITRDRLDIPYSADVLAHKHWVDNRLSEEDATLIIDQVLGGYAGEVSDTLKQRMIDIHLQFLNKHPDKNELSSRQLILMVQGLRGLFTSKEHVALPEMDKAVFQAAMTAYFERLSSEDRDQLAHILGDLLQKYMGDWGGAMDAVAYGVGLGMPVAIREANGADALELVRKLCLTTGWDLDIFWSDPDTKRSHLVSAIAPVLEETFDKYGVRKQTMHRDFRRALGFLAQHMITREELDAVKRGTQHKHTVLFFHMMDAVPERQRVMLNTFLAKMGNERSLMIQDEEGRSVEYVLPPWVQIIMSSPIEHGFSSAFINRFLPVRIEPPTFDEARLLVKERFPLVDDREFDWMWKVVRVVSATDFELDYGFSPEDIFKLASIVQDLKKKSWKPLVPDPLYYVVKAFRLVYLGAMKDGDLRQMEKEILFKELLMPIFEPSIGRGELTRGQVEAYYRLLKRQIANDLSFVGTTSVTQQFRADAFTADKSLVFPNGIRFRYEDVEAGTILVTTPARSYRVTRTAIQNPYPITDEMRLRTDPDSGEIIFEYKVLNGVGGFLVPQDEWNLARALPIHEVSTQTYMEMTPQHAQFLSGITNAWQSRRDKTGHVRSPRVSMISGETGFSKTTGIVNFSQITGIPIYTLNSYEDLKTQDVMMDLGIAGGAMEVRVKEFLARIGKIRKQGSDEWQKIQVPGQTMTSRVIVLWDEANVSPDLMYALAPLFRGEKTFSRTFNGETYEIEIENEVLLAMTFNPSETYGDRGSFAKGIAGYAYKFWPFNPVRYSDEQLLEILREYSRRGIQSVRESLELQRGQVELALPEKEEYVINEYSPLPGSPEDMWELDALGEHSLMQTSYRFPNPQHDDAWVRHIRNRLRDAELNAELDRVDDKPEDILSQAWAPDESHVLTYDLDLLAQHSSRYRAEGQITDWMAFSKNVIAPFLQAVSNMEFAEDTSQTRQILQDVLFVARSIDKELETALYKLHEMYFSRHVREALLNEYFVAIRHVLAEPGRDIYLVLGEVATSKEKAPYLFVLVQPILRRFVEFSKKHFDALGVDPESNMRRAESPRAIVLPKSPQRGLLGYFEGEFAVVFLEDVTQFAGPELDPEEAVGWTAWHELGHMIDQMRYRLDGPDYPIPHNVELNAMLFPLIFASRRDQYLERLGKLLQRATRDNVYAQAVKGIFNGLWIRHQEKHLRRPIQDIKRDPAFWADLEDELITNNFESERISRIIDALRKLNEQDLADMAVHVYRHEHQYLYSAEAGSQEVMVNDGEGWEKTFIAGLDAQYKQKIKGVVKKEAPKVESAKDIERPSFEPVKKKGEQGGGGGKTSEGGSEFGGVFDEGEDDDGLIVDFAFVSPMLLRKFLELFAGWPQIIEFTNDEGGDQVRIDAWIEMMRSGMASEGLFVSQQIRRALAKGYFGVTVDVSGSTKEIRQFVDAETGKLKHATINEIFVEMSRQFISLFYKAAVTNKDIQMGLGAYGSDYYSLLEPRDSRKAAAVKHALKRLKNKEANEGTNLQRAIEEIIKKHKGSSSDFPKLEIVITDGLVEIQSDTLKKAHELGIDIVILGYETPDVLKLPKSLNFPSGTAPGKMLEAILKIAVLKTRRGAAGMLPFDIDLTSATGVGDSAGARLANHQEISALKNYLDHHETWNSDSRLRIIQAIHRMVSEIANLHEHSDLVRKIIEVLKLHSVSDLQTISNVAFSALQILVSDFPEDFIEKNQDIVLEALKVLKKGIGRLKELPSFDQVFEVVGRFRPWDGQDPIGVFNSQDVSFILAVVKIIVEAPDVTFKAALDAADTAADNFKFGLRPQSIYIYLRMQAANFELHPKFKDDLVGAYRLYRLLLRNKYLAEEASEAFWESITHLIKASSDVKPNGARLADPESEQEAVENWEAQLLESYLQRLETEEFANNFFWQAIRDRAYSSASPIDVPLGARMVSASEPVRLLPAGFSFPEVPAVTLQVPPIRQRPLPRKSLSVSRNMLILSV